MVGISNAGKGAATAVMGSPVCFRRFDVGLASRGAAVNHASSVFRPECASRLLALLVFSLGLQRPDMLFSFAIAALSASTSAVAGTPRDTSVVRATMPAPTVHHAPVVGLRFMLVADSIVVEKGMHTLTLFRSGAAVRSYQVALGKQPVGDKIRQGDGRTPEGVFRVDFRNAQSKYHMSLHISYPDAVHQKRAAALGAAPGGDIMIHGLPPAFSEVGATHRDFDWTDGCIAVTDAEIEEIWRAVPNGAPIQIKP